MAAMLERTEIGIKDTGTSCTVPNSPVAKLMYYFDCVCSCVEPDEDAEIRRLRDYENYQRLTTEEQAKLFLLCVALSPKKLPIFIHSENIPNKNNQFLELSAVNTKMVVTETVLVGGQMKRVAKVMLYKQIWLQKNYINPIKQLKPPDEGPNHLLHCLLTCICPFWIFVWICCCCIHALAE